MEAAAAAALEDPRFPPVRSAELPQLEVEISVLSPCQPIAASDIQVGVHGLMITQGQARGVLLPQVPVEHHWSREQFLEETCRKAGLPPDAWKRGARIEAFTAEVFGEDR
jgi:AmmeMemoRadiSam system protein A